ncbi:MAG: hypothetical protein P1P82_05100 [Bacteroidales bacterium]|nr:hypothetical protein [Bacteroidales bacterium]MDT8430816.1 hypothetical protein [Bacteroidales bacterium]
MKKKFFGSKTWGKIVPMIFSAALIMGVSSCDTHTIEFPEEGYESFSASIQPVFTKKCVPCHSGSRAPNLSEGASYGSLTNNGYIDTDNPASSLLYTKLQEGSHSSYTTAADEEMILDWIQAGAPND